MMDPLKDVCGPGKAQTRLLIIVKFTQFKHYICDILNLKFGATALKEPFRFCFTLK